MKAQEEEAGHLRFQGGSVFQIADTVKGGSLTHDDHGKRSEGKAGSGKRMGGKNASGGL
jgi:hypothetical protein